MSHATFDAQLDLLESQLRELSSSLIDGNAVLLQETSIKFQQLAIKLLQTMGDTKRIQQGSPSCFQRVKALASGMVTFRENLLRRSAYIDHALGVLIPATGDKSTYAGTRVYGGPAKRSGSFSAFSA